MQNLSRYPTAVSVAAVIALVSLMTSWPTVGQQLTMTVTTDKPSYDYGEIIEVRSEVQNDSDSSYLYVGSSSCFATLERFNDIVFEPICTVDEAHISLHPGDVREDVWRLEPQLLGLPNTSGLHTIYVSTPAGTDSVQIHSPKYYGGMIKIGFAESTTESEIQALADSLDRLDVVGRGLGWEIWLLSGLAIDSLAEALRDDPMMTVIEPYREYPYNQWQIVASSVAHITSSVDVLLKQNFPNPTARSTTFEYVLERAADVRLEIFDALGRQVALLAESWQQPGTHQVDFGVGHLSPGVYLYRLSTGKAVHMRQMIIVR